MKYLLKEDLQKQIKKDYRNVDIKKTSGLSLCYISLIINRRRSVQKRVAFAFTKAISVDLEIEDLFERV